MSGMFYLTQNKFLAWIAYKFWKYKYNIIFYMEEAVNEDSKTAHSIILTYDSISPYVYARLLFII